MCFLQDKNNQNQPSQSQIYLYKSKFHLYKAKTRSHKAKIPMNKGKKPKIEESELTFIKAKYLCKSKTCFHTAKKLLNLIILDNNVAKCAQKEPETTLVNPN